MTVETKSFDSSFLADASYDDETQTLSVQLVSGREYTVEGVPPEKWAGLQNAWSAGRFLREQIFGQF